MVFQLMKEVLRQIQKIIGVNQIREWNKTKNPVVRNLVFNKKA